MYIIFDTEVFAQDWIAVFKLYGKDRWYVVHNDCNKIKDFFNNHTDDIFVSFNGKNYDQFIIKATLNSALPETVKSINDWIISDKNGYNHPFIRECREGSFNHCDLMDDCQVGTSLKSFEAHSFMNIEETEVDFNLDRPLTQKELEQTIHYCKYDVSATEKLFEVRSAYINNKISVGNMAGLPIEKSLNLTNGKLTAALLRAEKHEYNDERKYVYPTNLKREYIPQEVFDFFNRMYDTSLTDDQIFKSKLNIEIAGCPTTIAYGGIHSAILNYQEGSI